jgi:hypothetical protein
MSARESSPPPIQLLGYDGGVEVTEVPLLFDQVANGLASNPYGEEPIEARYRTSSWTHHRPRHPLVEHGPV